MFKLSRFLVPIAAATLLLAGCSATADPDASSGDAQNSDPLVVQFVPSRTDTDMQALARPLADLLSAQLGREVEVTIATDYSTIVEAMASGQVDVGIMPPASYVLAADQGAADALLSAQIYGADPVTADETDQLVAGFHGEIVVAADSGITSIADLAGKTIAVQNAASASGYIFPVVELADSGLDVRNDLTLTTISGIDSALLAVLNGEVDAALSFEGGRRLLKSEFPDITDRLSVLYLTDATIPNDVIAASSSLSDEEKTAVQDAFLAAAADPEGAEVLATLYSHRGYVVADQSAYDIVRDYTARAGEL